MEKKKKLHLHLHGKTNRQKKFYQKKKKPIIKCSLAQEDEWSNGTIL
jgi:hypothetical protein